MGILSPKRFVQKLLGAFGWEFRRRSNQHVTPMTAEWMGVFFYFMHMYERIRSLPGDIVECGVGRGRTLLFLAFLVQKDKGSRTLWGFDSFAGFPEPATEDQSPRNPQKGERNNTSVDYVKWLLRDSGIGEEVIESKVKLIQGFFDQTLSRFHGPGIALLHIDADLYQSYKDTLTMLYPKVVRGGLVLFDEYHDPAFPGATKAIDEYFHEKGVKIQQDPLSKKHFLVKP